MKSKKAPRKKPDKPGGKVNPKMKPFCVLYIIIGSHQMRGNIDLDTGILLASTKKIS